MITEADILAACRTCAERGIVNLDAFPLPDKLRAVFDGDGVRTPIYRSNIALQPGAAAIENNIVRAALPR